MPKKKNPNSAPAASTTPPIADAPALTPAAATVLTLLDPHDGATAADLADRAGLGRSTATKALAALHDAGLAVRQEGGHEGTRRIADLWFAAPGTTAPAAADADRQATDDAHGLAALGDGTAEESHTDTIPDVAPDDAAEELTAPALSEAETTGDRTATDEPSEGHPEEAAEPEPDSDGEADTVESVDDATTDRAPDDEAVQDEPAGSMAAEIDGTGPDLADGPEPEFRADAVDPIAVPADEATEQAKADGDGAAESERDTRPLSASADMGTDGPDSADDALPAPQAAKETKASGPRLGKGELRAQVEEHLRAHPEKAFTSTEIHHVLQRSSGAIANACDKLVADRKAVVATDKPRRFQWNPADESDAA